MKFYLDAGHYAAFLWPAYGISAATLAGLVIQSVVNARRWRKRAEDGERKQP